jgi:VanZ family protein
LDRARAKEFLNYWLPALLFSLAILVLSGDLGSSRNTGVLVRWALSWMPGLTPGQIDLLNGYLRKLGHLTAYGFLFFLWFRALRGHFHAARPWSSALWALAICLLVSCLDEGHQAWYHSRGGSPWDVALDMVGALLSAVVISIVSKLRPKPAGPAG